MRKRALGIDLGGCMGGNSGYTLLEWDGGTPRILAAVREPKHSDHRTCARFLEKIIEETGPDLVAVDAPLSLPRPLHDPNFTPPEREGRGEILNPYLYRYTDYYLHRRFGLRPMPPAAERIGRITARALELLHRRGDGEGYLRVGGRRIAIYEVFPRQIARALGIENYKKEPATLFARTSLPRRPLDEHLLDALLCAYAGIRIHEGETVPPPPEAEGEGWCHPLLPRSISDRHSL